MAFFWAKERLFKVSVLRVIYLVAFVLFFVLTEIGRKIYRPWVYQTHINDFGIADTIGNSLGTLTQIFLYLGLTNATKVESYRIIAFVTVGYIAYEIVQPILPRGTFDWKDVLATLAAGILAAAAIAIIHFFFPEPDRSNPGIGRISS
jgi:hypothetical protein